MNPFEKTKPIPEDPVMSLTLYPTSTYKNKKASAEPKPKSLFEKTKPIFVKVK